MIGGQKEELEKMSIIKYKNISKLEKTLKNNKIKNLITRKRLISLVLVGTLTITYLTTSLKNKKNIDTKSKQNFNTLDNSITPSPNKPLESVATIEATILPTIDKTSTITLEPTTNPTPVLKQESTTLLPKETTILETTFTKQPTELIKRDSIQESISVSNVEPTVDLILEPIIYIYNTHSSETYNSLNNTISTVKDASYLLKEELEKLGIGSFVEPENTSDILKSKGLHYRNSYKISRSLLEDRNEEYETLEYFIDLHRDSVNGNVSTITIDDKRYAKIMFVLGLENKNYKENLALMEVINAYLDENYPGLSRGIYKKKGKKVNGVYNQDFSPNTILIEIGGVDNTIDEVSNSIKVIANALNYCINQEKIVKR